jgi:hypothetical protein
MLNVYRIELRRSPLLAAFPLLVAVDLLVLFGRSRYWIGVWPEASVAAQVTTLFLGPVLSGVSAWQAGRSLRAGMPEGLLAVPRPDWQIEAARFSATLTLGFLAYAVGGMIAAAVSFKDAGHGFLWPSYLLLGATTLVIFASVGHLAGRWWPSPAFTPVVCALGCFISMLALPVKFNVLAGPPDTRMRMLPVVMRLLCALALATVALTAPAIRRGPIREMSRPRTPLLTRGVAVVSAAAAVFLLTSAIPAAGELREERPSSAVTPLCERADDTAPLVCVWPEHRKYLPALARMAQRLDHAGRFDIKAPREFREFGLRRTQWGDRGFDITEGHVRTAAIAMADNVFTDSFGLCRPPTKDRRAWQAMDAIHLWLEYLSMGEDPAEADRGLHMEGISAAQHEATGAARMSASGQQDWLARQRGYIDPAWCHPDVRY